MSERLFLRAGTLLTPRSTFERVTVVVSAGRIEALVAGAAGGCGEAVIDASDGIVVPGFIDLHVHGGAGHDTMDGTPEAVRGLAAFHARHGTTALLPSTVAAPDDELEQALQAVAAVMDEPPAGARVLGAHVEGPFLSQEKRGAHLAAHVRPPRGREERWLWDHLGAVRRVTLAPELPGALELIGELRRAGVLVSLGHSTAGEEGVAAAALAGASHVTHLYNAMSALEKVGPLRRVGLAELGLVRDDLTVEVIADGWHLPVPLLQLIVRAKGPARTALVTDAMRAAGLAEGRYVLGREGAMGVTVGGGMAVTDEGGLAGSIATMEEVVRSAVHRVGLALAQAVQMATLTPAQILGVADRLGEIAPGKAADLVVLDRDLGVVATIVGGRVVHQRDA